MRKMALPGTLIALIVFLASPAQAVIGPPAANATSTPQNNEARFLKLHNEARAHAGVAPLRTSRFLTELAWRRSAEMAAANDVWHDYGIARYFSVGRLIGENVGRGSSADDLFAAFMDSPSHRENILQREYREIGIASPRGDDDQLYVTIVFLGPAPLSASAQKPASRAPNATDSIFGDREVNVLVQLVTMED